MKKKIFLSMTIMFLIFVPAGCKSQENDYDESTKKKNDNDINKVINTLEMAKDLMSEEQDFSSLKAVDKENYESLVTVANVAGLEPDVFIALKKEKATITMSKDGVTVSNSELFDYMKSILPEIESMKVLSITQDEDITYVIDVEYDGEYGIKVTKKVQP